MTSGLVLPLVVPVSCRGSRRSGGGRGGLYFGRLPCSVPLLRFSGGFPDRKNRRITRPFAAVAVSPAILSLLNLFVLKKFLCYNNNRETIFLYILLVTFRPERLCHFCFILYLYSSFIRFILL